MLILDINGYQQISASFLKFNNKNEDENYARFYYKLLMQVIWGKLTTQ